MAKTTSIIVLLIACLLFGCTITLCQKPPKSQIRVNDYVSHDIASHHDLAITANGMKTENHWQPQSLIWSESCRAYSQKQNPCLRAWVDNEIKVKRSEPLTWSLQQGDLTSFFWIRRENGKIVNPKQSPIEPGLLDRRLWIEQIDMLSITHKRVPAHALPMGKTGGIVPGNGLPDPIFRVGVSYDATCLKRNEMQFPLATLRKSGRVARIIGRFVAVNPNNQILRKLEETSKAMATENQSPWQTLDLGWHKPAGTSNWISDELVMLSTKDWITFRRPVSDYTDGEINFKNKNEEMRFLGEWLLAGNVAPAPMRGIFARTPDDKPGRVYFTLPTIRPRLNAMRGTIFVPLAVEIIVGMRHPRHGHRVIPLGCVPFEQKGMHGNLTRQLLAPMLKASKS